MTDVAVNCADRRTRWARSALQLLGNAQSFQTFNEHNSHTLQYVGSRCNGGFVVGHSACVL